MVMVVTGLKVIIFDPLCTLSQFKRYLKLCIKWVRVKTGCTRGDGIRGIVWPMSNWIISCPITCGDGSGWSKSDPSNFTTYTFQVVSMEHILGISSKEMLMQRNKKKFSCYQRMFSRYLEFIYHLLSTSSQKGHLKLKMRRKYQQYPRQHPKNKGTWRPSEDETCKLIKPNWT